MNKKYLMGKSDSINRINSFKLNETYINPSLKKELLKLSIIEAFNCYCFFFNINNNFSNIDELVNDYNTEFIEANSLGLFLKGGIREKDHLNFWCLSRVLKPKLYIESGVFIGSSLHAFLKTPNINKVIAIDPNLKKLKIDIRKYNYVELIDKLDFSQIEIKNIPNNALVYFDDHINTAQRIIQSHKKGIKYLLFDDSTGFEGVCQRLYPAVPTLPMIMNYESFSINDEIIWDWYLSPIINFKYLLKEILSKNKKSVKRISLKIDKDFIEQCKEAKSLVKNYIKIPNLGVYIPQRNPEKMVDTTKYLLELKKIM